MLENLAEKMDKCPTVELGVPQYPPEKEREREERENDSPWSL